MLVAISRKALVPVILKRPAICSTWSAILLYLELSIHVSFALWACPHEYRAITYLRRRIIEIVYLLKITGFDPFYNLYYLIPLKKPQLQNINFHTFADCDGKTYLGYKS